MLSPLIFAALLQVGPNPDPDSIANTIPRSPREEVEIQAKRPDPRAVPAGCPLANGASAIEVFELAVRQAGVTSGDEQIAALQCAAMAQAELRQWNEAAASFLKARDLAQGKSDWQARIGTQRAHALVEAGRIIEARAAFRDAIDDAILAGDSVTAGQIAADQAIVEVAAGDQSAAAATLAAARERSPGEYRIWLLSATLARRNGQLDDAQSFIEQAASLDAIDPEVGLEAGVIAALSGRLAAARASFESVAAQPHAGARAHTARQYLAQLDEMEASPQ